MMIPLCLFFVFDFKSFVVDEKCILLLLFYTKKHL